MNNKKTKKVTIADLAKMIKEDVVDHMATKDDLLKLELKLTTEINDLRMDFKGFKKDSNDSIDKHTVDIDDLNDSLLLQDKRMEKLEMKK